MDAQVMTLIKRMDKVSKPQFLLIQGDKILGVSPIYHNLPYRTLDQTQNWMVVVGTIKETGKPEIVATIAEAYPKPGKFCYRISSPLDGENRLVGNATSMIELITSRIRILYNNRCYDNVNDLPPTIVIVGCDSGAPDKKGRK